MSDTQKSPGKSVATADSEPLVSVILPTYNRAALVTRAVESVLAQTYPNLELIIIVDGSTDDTLQRLEPYRRHARIVHQANAGLGAARNTGISLARGRFIAFLDDDDIWHPEKIRIQIEFFMSHPECSVVSVPAATIRSPGSVLDDALSLRDGSGMVARPLRQKAAGRLLISPCGIMFDRQKALTAAFYPVPRCLEDITFLVDALASGGLGIAGDGPLIFINEGSDGSLGAAPDSWVSAAAHMRKLYASGGLGPRKGPMAADTGELVAFIARTAAVRCLHAGRLADGLKIYLRELFPQLRLGRWRFVVGFPTLMLRSVIYGAPRR
jgi:glycosyltransferase involved in cell wall biosynthesis